MMPRYCGFCAPGSGSISDRSGKRIWRVKTLNCKLEEIARAIATALRVVVKPRPAVPVAPKPAEAGSVAKPRRNLLFSSASRKEREEILARAYGASWGDVRSKRADRSPPGAGLGDPVTVLKTGVVDGMAYSLYSDGSIEAQMPEGMLRFASLDELRSHLEQRP